MFCSFAIPFLACPYWLLEWRTRDYARFDSQRGRTASGRHRGAANNGIAARTRVPRVWRAGHQLRWMDWRFADARRERFPICGVNVADRKCRARDLAEPGSAPPSTRTRPGKRRTRSGCASFSLELPFARPAGVRSNADSIRHWGVRFDCSTRGNRGNPPNMARLGTVTRATRTFRSSHDAGNYRVPEKTRRSVSTASSL